MIILPDRHIPRARLLLPVSDREWRKPSQRRQTYGIEDQTRFRLTARLNDGHIVWRGWFDDRDAADTFMLAIALGNLTQDPGLWRLPTPQWHPGMGESLAYEFATVVFLTGTSGSNQTYTIPSDWGSSANTIETIGAGGSGAAGFASNSAGGGAGEGAGRVGRAARHQPPLPVRLRAASLGQCAARVGRGRRRDVDHGRPAARGSEGGVMARKKKRSTFEATVVAGPEGVALYINGCRIAGPKPWGGGKVLHVFSGESCDVAAALKGGE